MPGMGPRQGRPRPTAPPPGPYAGPLGGGRPWVSPWAGGYGRQWTPAQRARARLSGTGDLRAAPMIGGRMGSRETPYMRSQRASAAMRSQAGQGGYTRPQPRTTTRGQAGRGQAGRATRARRAGSSARGRTRRR